MEALEGIGLACDRYKTPDAIGELLHLRYLDLFGSDHMRMLPEAITKLINLQFLKLDWCFGLKELPRDFKKLVNLRTLYVPALLEYMPLGMASMTSLTGLNTFIVGHRKSCMKQENMLEDLRVLRNLKGSLYIRIKEHYNHAKEYCWEGGYICNTQHLNSIFIRGGYDDLLEDLQSHRNLKELSIQFYDGVRIPRWAREDSLTTSLPNLVQIRLRSCDGLEELPWLGRLQHLKELSLDCLKNVEYMENRRSGVGSSSDDGDVASNSSTAVESSSMLFFPSLEKLTLRCMPKLKGWWRRGSNCASGSRAEEDEIVNGDNNICMLTTPAHPLPSFPNLSYLSIERCQNLTYIPLCPVVETLEFDNGYEFIKVRIEEEKKVASGSSRSMYPIALHMLAIQGLVRMTICRDDKVESLSEFEEVLRGCSSSLCSLALIDCKKLRSVSQGGLEYLTALEQLELHSLPELEFDETEENEEEGSTSMPWRCLGKCLRSLKLWDLEKMVNLPKGMRYLTSLQYLEIRYLPLKEIPEWIECLSTLVFLSMESCYYLKSLPRELRNLTSLKKFELMRCHRKLKRRCEKIDGEYWPIIEHIPHLYIE